jgi:hypothetical protein
MGKRLWMRLSGGGSALEVGVGFSSSSGSDSSISGSSRGLESTDEKGFRVVEELWPWGTVVSSSSSS